MREATRVTSPRSAAAAALVAALALGAAGCSLLSGQGEKTPGPVRLRVTAAARLNPDERGESLPTAVRVYQLKGSARARSVELAPLLRDPKEALGEDFVSVDELFVDPAGSSEKTIPVDKATRAVAVVAVFRRPAGESWREVVELPAGGKPLALAYLLEEYRIVRRP